MLTKSLRIFCKRKEAYAERLTQFAELQELNNSDHEKILEILREFLMDPDSVDDVSDCFPQLLPALASTSISMDKVSFNDGDNLHRLNSVVLGKLVRRNSDLLAFALHYFDSNPAPFESIDTDYKPSPKRRNRRKVVSLKEVSDYAVVSACYDILCSAPTHFKYKWNWSKFYKYLIVDDEGVRWVALNCISTVLGMSEPCRLSCASSFLPNVQQFLTEHEEIMKNTVVCGDPEKIDEIAKKIPSVVSVGGILLPVFQRPKSKRVLNLVPVPSTRRNLQNLALAVSSNKCVCLQGAVGSGKTALVEFLSQATGHDTETFSKVQLGDQTDSKMLLGMYRCTDVPGEFLWQPGILTEAVLNGKWLLLEDIDCAATDVASVIGHLVETKTLSVPGYRDSIRAKSGFQLFVTRRLASGGTQKSLQSSALLQKHWTCVNAEPLSKEELITVVQTLFPVLNTVATRIIDVFLLFSVGNHEDDVANYARTGRQTSTRDLIKWCSRAIVDFDVSSPDSALKIFQDALDVFCCAVPDRVQRLNLAISVAHKLGIIKTKAEYFCGVYKPSINLHRDALVIGRSKLPRKKSDRVRMETKKSNFSYTRPSMCLLERITSCVAQREPVLLVGETGTGKTSCIQYLAQVTGHKLIVINMNQQSESADLLGGYKPVDLKFLISPIREEFEILFRSYFAVEPNKKFLTHLARCFEDRKWKTLATLMIHSTSAALKRLRAAGDSEELQTLKKWEKIAQKLEKLQSQVRSQYSLAFSFVEGSLVKALKNGDWVLLDEINLATAETLECLSGLLEGSCGSLSLLERGDKDPINRHQDFAIFACMNPATDVGKKDLPIGLRNRFTEFFVDELTEKSDLQLLVSSYLKDLNLAPEKLESIVKFYLNVRKEAENSLLDGTGHKPHYSLRTLCRALSVSAYNPCGNVLRSLYESFSLSFLTQLDSKSYPLVQRMIVKAVLGEKMAKEILGEKIPRPRAAPGDHFVCFEGYWIPRGDLEPRIPENYILTETVKRNLKDLVRVVSIGKMPVLLQGDTSVGKTSLITYLAKASGHTCVRINNHEHTDLQEYVGTYVADSTGKLVFKEGILVDAMRKGYWIILDELNLAPSDVLEALNRVLDDNRELFIPETQQVIKAHENFMLFATQNPPGLYGGRKVLSRAFRNRFVELHFDEIPANELLVILQKRCKMPESYCKQVINVMTELQMRRKSTATFAGKKGFITLRDLFRWAERYHLAPDIGNQLYDWNQHLADEGYLVLSSKVRHPEEFQEILQVLKKHLRRDVDPESLFSLSEKTSPVTRPILESLLSEKLPGFEHVVWTFQMRKMAVLLRKACDFKEPVLLIGETGGGKTTVCQLLSVIRKQELSAVNCHMHTEASDFLGSLRPVREHRESQKLFEWVDGPLVKAMKTGGFFLADEISLADDSVLERLNSLLEPERKLLVAEKPSDDDDSIVIAHKNFIFVGTMNPGGDYGKKELSPALRNRFTEVWCEGCVTPDDLKRIMAHNLREELKDNVSTAMLEFLEWLKTTEIGRKLVISVRDVLTWVEFVNICRDLEIGDAFYHGASLSYLDGLGSGLTASENPKKLKDFKSCARDFIERQVRDTLNSKLCSNLEDSELENSETRFGIKPFYIEKGGQEVPGDFAFASPTTRMNTLKLLRALQLKKPILLEGSPGVGKTSLVSALARASGHELLRLNLSDQTDISDLFGADLPVEGGKPGEFSWRDGPFLRALKNGDWILLDELNLASQSVLEGLNACLDHRGEVYVPELGMTFHVKPGTRLFGCQNPLRQGGGRRGLPKSFLNRFTQVFVDALEERDLRYILKSLFPELPEDLLVKMITFNERLSAEVGVTWAHAGSPWEMNLRDVTRWCQTTIAAFKKDPGNVYNPGDGAELIYVDRMRTLEDKERVRTVYREIFADYTPPAFPVRLAKEKLFLGDEVLDRGDSIVEDDLLLLREQRTSLRDLARCVNMNWMAILVGSSGCGKSSLVRVLANLAGQKLKTIVVNSAMDTTEILGGFEQTDYNRHFEELLERTETLLIGILRKKLRTETLEQVANYHSLLEAVRHLSDDDERRTETTMSSETKLFLRKTEELSKLVSAMKTSGIECEEELREIQGKLTDLSIAVENDKCLNAGGKFEWVDSVLVKCLQNGSWLLLDQVNLCSPAILDRLNGLLEPNGTLTIGEKGVDDSGNVFTVKPHKNFRLFLTMDPRHGEISRAMRNRGVEICVPTPKHVGDYNSLDLKSLLNNCGIKQLNRQNLLLKIHESLSPDRFGLIELLQTASFASRQISKGFGFRKSVKNACREIYAAFDSRSRKETLRKIDEILAEFSEDDGSFEYDLDAITPTIDDLQRNARLAIIRQQGFLLKSATEMLRNKDRLGIDFHDLFEDEKLITNSAEFLKHLLLDFYERCSVDDLQIRRVWSSRMFEKSGSRNLEKLGESLCREIGKFNHLLRDESCFESPLNSGENSTFFNSLALAMYFRSMINEDRSTKDRSRDKDIMLLKDYSTAVCSGKLSTNLKNEPLITTFVKLIDQSRRTIETVLRDEKFAINDKRYVELRDDLKWYQRFHQLGEIPLIDRSRGTFLDLRETSSSLKVHYKWLLKFFKRFFDLFDQDSCHPKMRQELRNFANICSTFAIDSDRFKKVRKKIRKHLLHLPSPHFSENAMNFYEKQIMIARRFEVIEEDLIDHARTRSKIEKIRAIANSTQREEIIEIYSEIFRENRLESDGKLDAVSEIISIDHSQIDPSVSLKDTEMWPIYEFFFVFFASLFQAKICENLASDFSGEIAGKPCEKLNVETADGKLAGMLRMFEKVPTIPVRLLALVAVLNDDDVPSPRKLCLLLRLFVLIEGYPERSFVTRNSGILLRWHAPPGESEGNSENSERNLISKSALLSLIFELLLTKSGANGETMNLRNYKEKKEHMKILQNLLWKNSVILNSDKFDFSTNDSVLLRFFINYYLSAIETANFVTEKLTDEEKNDLENRFLKPAKTLREISEKLAIQEETMERGKAWLILGHLQIFLSCDPGSIDPVQKIALKSKYLRENVMDLEHSIHVEKLQSLVLGTSLKNDRYSSKIDRLSRSISDAEKLQNFHAVRPNKSFQTLRDEMENFARNIGSQEAIFRQIDRLSDLAQKIKNGRSTSVDHDKIREAIIWKKSIERFSGKLEKNFLVGFPDLVFPVISAISALRHGISVMIDEITNLESQNASSNLYYNLLRFPTLGFHQENYTSLVKACFSEKTVFLLAKNGESKTIQRDRIRLSKIALKELENLSLCRGISSTSWESLNEIFQKIRVLWREQEKQREEKTKEEQSLFKRKQESPDDEEEDFRKMFPGFQEDYLEILEMYPGHQDLSDVQKPREVSVENESFLELISPRDATEIRQFHQKILMNSDDRSHKASRRSRSEINVTDQVPDYIDPLIQRYELLGSSLKSWPENFCGKLLNGLTVLAARKSIIDQKPIYDFYRDPNLPEIEACQPHFERLVNRIQEFLKDWPENPVLISINAIIDRILGFSIDSALSRFLVGVELLLTKLQNWEETARTDVSVMEFIEYFGKLILRWRKMEISRWKESLEVLEENLKSEASKWWFFLFDLVEQYLETDCKSPETPQEDQSRPEDTLDNPEKIQGDDQEDPRDDQRVPKEKLIQNLERFITESSLIQFQTRLQLIYLFHQHIDHYEDTKAKKELSAILWNVYRYYDQFSAEVEAKMKRLKDPIAAKLRDTIKITRWNDVSYWSVKNTAEKTRRTLHNYVKKYQKCLQENVASHLTLKSQRETLEKSHRRDLGAPDFLIDPPGRESKIDKVTGKARQFCQDIITACEYRKTRGEIEDFVEEMMLEGQRLRDLEIDRSLPKGKQQAHAKSILQRKKMALANYFKALARIGVSYRIGILTWKSRKSQIVDFTCTPLDLAEIRRFGCEGNLDAGLMEQWSGCEKYYYGSLVKLNALDAVLNTARNDLGAPNIERCRGFSVHLVLMAHKLRRTIAGFFQRFLPFRIQVSNLAAMSKDTGKRDGRPCPPDTPRQSDLRTALKSFREMLVTLDISLRQIVIFLESRPGEVEDQVELDLSVSRIPGLLEESVSGSARTSMGDSLGEIKRMSTEVNSWIMISERIESSGQMFFLHERHFEFLQSGYDRIEKIKGDLLDLRTSFSLDHPIAANLTFLIEKIDNKMESFRLLAKSPIEVSGESENLGKFREKLDSLVTQILIVVQEKFKDSSKETEKDQEKEEEDFEENALTDHLIGSLRKDITDLRLKTVFRILGELLEIVSELDGQSANHCISSLLGHVALLQQYTLLLQHYLHEQVATYRLVCKFLYLQLNAFLELAANGFCQPQDAEKAEEEGDGEQVEGGMGLADGEGQKDVSERIESEDQLEDARRPGDEKEEDKKDSKEEENGIEMSENFDSHLQDMEKDEDDENREPDDDDVDKEMGDTEENADKLDKEMWKDEEEEEDEKNEEKNEDDKKDEKGSGEDIGEEELTAKDTEEKTNKDQEETDGQRKEEEEKKEINEFEEPEVDDDQIDPYHGKNQPEIEPEPFELPEDIDMDEDMKEDGNENEEDPFDIDQMKDGKEPEVKEPEEEVENEGKDEENKEHDSSDEEDENQEENGDKKKDRVKDVDGEKEETPEEEKKDEEEQANDEEKAQPSLDEGSKEVDASEEVNSRKDGSRDAVESQSNEEQEQMEPTERNAVDKNYKGTGQSQSEERTGHSGSTKEENVPTSGQETESKPMERRRKPGESDENRSLLDDETEPRAKKLKTAPTQQEMDAENEANNADNSGENEVYEHIKNTEKFDDFALDAATEEQMKKQASNIEQDKEDEMDEDGGNEDIEMHEDDAKEDENKEDTKKERPERTAESKREKSKNANTDGSNDNEEMEIGGEIDGETVETTKIPRGNESTFHTQLGDPEPAEAPLDVEQRRLEIQQMLSDCHRVPTTVEAANAWSSISTLTESAARELSEKLRLVLEPTLTSRLRGDYRTGRRINMRKIIPYVASEFRKDKIWLRRTRPSRRDYQIVLAIDDSSSMADNHSKELAFESLSLIGKAMTYLEVGQLAVLNFGERVNILHPLGENFSEESGARLIQEMKFEQKRTMIGQLLDFTVEMFESHGGGSDNAKLVAILSDGRGIFSEGIDKVTAAVRRAKLSNIFLVFIIVDNPQNKDSILDIRMPIFENGKLLGIRSYMDSFPFPFYIILRDLNTLPVVLSDALRQWFEIVGRIDT